MSILLLETLHPDAEALLAQHDRVILAADEGHALQVAQQDGVAAILTRGKGRITRALMRACGTSLKAVSRAGAGLDTVDLGAAKELGVAVIFAPGLNAQTTAEHTVMLMMMAARKAAFLDAQVKAGCWSVRNGYEGVELNGKTLGVIGLGSIGARVAQIGQALGMQVIYWSRRTRDARFAYRALDDLLREADVISLHIALSEETQGLIGARELALMKPGAILVNTARGALIDQRALTEALCVGRLGAFAADVLAQQPPSPDDPLLRCERVTLTPHVAGLTDRTYREVCLFCARNVLAVLRDEPPDPRSLYSG
ncbi:MAG: phosphoglycerate dehydrogenase [Chloroflexi bacterium]|jgi:phosphoglycerate dehydrogenase-like enzyme|uniref:Phosphoglycerate dehydrogenase n=1 Tax=Candidatus Thermofonsia Clade 3 bacterium TaxID=2364212 RepID=A0A2M8QCH9_9CHLR|nr:NAD(P)-dependent oxidoreductase [Candidatus Roseilinea sp. NK_OTU-006]PJF47513.1 MAG: phosphoglycerate dehydrogenase [Candidatus Thermofonsia Clade 3 bacterium]RMG63892.1 MAG: phosphoglycerate dehydrogenase [Chloroflexota bacterium]